MLGYYLLQGISAPLQMVYCAHFRHLSTTTKKYSNSTCRTCGILLIINSLNSYYFREGEVHHSRCERKPDLKTSELHDVAVVKNCYRCGGEFSTAGGRVCPVCRKPRVDTRKSPLSRNLSFREKQVALLVCK